MLKLLLKAVNSLISFILILALCTAGSYAGYALWDNTRVYAAAVDVQADMIKLKPEVEENQDGNTFDELLKINPDVTGWLTLPGTMIDHPILQGESNLEYVNKDVYGNFSLPGSIFLDVRNNRACTDPYILIYGHHMENSAMFGDLDLYKDESFFAENSSGGMLILPDCAYKLEIYACLTVRASDNKVFDPMRWQTDINGMLDYTEQNALHINPNALIEFDGEKMPQILAMSTCSNEFTDARTVVLAVTLPYEAIYPEEE